MIERRKLVDFLICASLLFIPFTAFRIMGLKISEILMLIAIPYSIIGLKFKDKWIVVKFLVSFTILIFLSALFNFMLGNHIDKIGVNDGIYYSYEYGFILKTIRFWIVGIFSITLVDLMKKYGVRKYLKWYLISTTFVNVYGIIQTLFRGAFMIGIDRTALFAVEPSEAGFINGFSIIIILFFIFTDKKSRGKYYFLLVIHLVMHLFIGSLASLAFLGGSIILVLFIYLLRNFNGKSFKYVLIGIIVCVGVTNYLVTETNVFDKVINYKYYMTIKGSSVAERLSAIECAVDMFKDNPVLGVGWGNYGWFVDKYKSNNLFNTVPGGRFSANNQYAVILSELGIVGIVIFTLFCIKLIKINFIGMKFNFDLNRKQLFLLSFILLMYILLFNLTLNAIYSFQFWICISLSIFLNKKIREY